jgi:hypothetical protein
LCKNIFGQNNVNRNADLDGIGVDFQLLFNGIIFIFLWIRIGLGSTADLKFKINKVIL